jgi:hypothetical protein
MASFSLPRRYQQFKRNGGTLHRERVHSPIVNALHGNVFQDFTKDVVAMTARVVKRGITSAPTGPGPAPSGLPTLERTASKMPLYLGAGAAALVLIMLLSGKRKTSAAPVA